MALSYARGLTHHGAGRQCGGLSSILFFWAATVKVTEAFPNPRSRETLLSNVDFDVSCIAPNLGGVHNSKFDAKEGSTIFENGTSDVKWGDIDD